MRAENPGQELFAVVANRLRQALDILWDQGYINGMIHYFFWSVSAQELDRGADIGEAKRLGIQDPYDILHGFGQVAVMCLSLGEGGLGVFAALDFEL